MIISQSLALTFTVTIALFSLQETSCLVPFTDWSLIVKCRGCNNVKSRAPLYGSLFSSASTGQTKTKRWNRRDLVRSILVVSTASIQPTNAAVAVAAEEAPPITKPFAPNEALLPAARVKLTIDRALELVEMIDTLASKKDFSLDDIQAMMDELERLLLQPQNYVGSFQLQGVPSKPAAQYLETYRPMQGDLPFQRYLIQSGDIRTWKSLKQSEKEQERNNEIRAALNAYTDALSFSGHSYLLNVDSKTKSSMIRESRLPSMSTVITSDMGLRYLYRNQIITAMDDVRAELKYQLLSQQQQSNNQEKQVTMDMKDLLDLLAEAQKACDQWFDLIDSKDVQKAVETVQSEQSSL